MFNKISIILTAGKINNKNKKKIKIQAKSLIILKIVKTDLKVQWLKVYVSITTVLISNPDIPKIVVNFSCFFFVFLLI